MKQRFIRVAGVIGLTALLATAAFLAGRLMTQRAKGDIGSSVVVLGGPAGAMAGRSMKVDIAPASELPATPPDAAGVFVRREDRSIYIGTGNHGVAGGGGVPTKLMYDGPVLEVVCTPDTQVYKDVTEFPESLSSDTRLQQVVEAGSLSEIDEQTSLRVWGERKGDRIVAQVLLYTQLRALGGLSRDPHGVPPGGA